MPTVYFIPGLAESTLAVGNATGEVVWVGVRSAIMGQFGRMRLAADGTSPGAPDGEHLVAAGLLAPYAGLPLFLLGANMVLDDYAVIGFEWDWRKSMLVAGDELAGRIRTSVSPSHPCSIICHSAGGIVARRAWSNLLATGQQGRIRRIVTLGTPHQGSYTAVNAMMASSNIIDVLYDFNRTVGDAVWGIASIVGHVRWTKEQIRDLLLTWPALYELLPLAGGDDASEDPHRMQLFQADNWKNGVYPQQHWLDHHVNVFAPWSRSPASRPPSEVLTCVAGSHYYTAQNLARPDRLGYADCLDYTSDGDSIVTVASAQLTDSQRVLVTVQHDNLFPTLVGTGDAREWIEAVRSPSPAPPPLEVDTQAHLPTLSPVPGLSNWQPWSGPRVCGVEPCKC